MAELRALVKPSEEGVYGANGRKGGKDEDDRTFRSVHAQAATQTRSYLKDENNPLHMRVKGFIRLGNIEALRRLVSEQKWLDGNIVVDSDIPFGEEVMWHTPALAWAAMNKRLEVMELLIELGAHVTEVRPCHQLASNCASGAGYVEGLQLLRAHGCDLLASDQDGTTPVMMAASHGEVSCLKWFVDSGYSLDGFNSGHEGVAHVAAGNGEVAVLQQLHDWGRRLDIVARHDR
jgi:hypothetical protein